MQASNHYTIRRADDASGSGKIESLREWWDQLSTQGTKFGYFVNAEKHD